MDDRREELERHLVWLTEAIESPGERDGAAAVAALIRERRLTVDAIAALPAEAEELSVADQLAAKRQARLTDTDDHSSATRRSQPRRSGRVHPAS